MDNQLWNDRIIKGLLWHAWLKHGRFLSWIAVAWLASFWILCFFNDPVFIIFLGALYGATAGLRFGGMEAVEGSAEFVYALPPTRKQRCFVTLTIGLATVAALALLGDLALFFNLPQAFWKLFVSSGFTEPYDRAEAINYWHALVIPLAVFAGTFATASFVKSRSAALSARWIGTIVIGLIFWISQYIESMLSQNLSRDCRGFVAVPALFLFSALSLTMAWHFHLVKEQIN